LINVNVQVLPLKSFSAFDTVLACKNAAPILKGFQRGLHGKLLVKVNKS